MSACFGSSAVLRWSSRSCGELLQKGLVEFATGSEETGIVAIENVPIASIGLPDPVQCPNYAFIYNRCNESCLQAAVWTGDAYL